MDANSLGSFDFESMLGGLIGNVPAMIRPAVLGFLSENGMVLGKEVSSDPIDIDGKSTWVTKCILMQMEPPVLLAVCRWTAGGYIPDELESVMVRAVIVTGNLDAELARVNQQFEQRIRRAP